ncbi:EamA family transporter RarD [Cohnella suwonensis]|uniref:EamA family transporter RarD n=1 Tax=Cohnella suwonensis TaxID=696072 RepID=A0ABW0M0Y8_9BACL
MRNGLGNAVIAYVMWGLLPLYWKLFEDVPAGEILSHRIVWSFVFMVALVAIQTRWGDMAGVFKNRAALLTLVASSLLIAANWLIFIWAVNNGHVVETSLGYYITPLLNVLLAVLFLREKPNRGQWLAVALAGAAVLLIAFDYGIFPWVSVSLAGTFGLYGLAKKKIKQDASIGLFAETAIVVPLALLYWAYLGADGSAKAWMLPAGTIVELLVAGVATALPLLFFAKAAGKLSLSTLGFVQYIGPTIQLALSAFVFKETITPALIVGFAIIWTAIAVYAASSVRAARTVTPRTSGAG